MNAAVGTGLARVTVVAPRRRLDVALPEAAPVAALLPELLRHAGVGLADDGEHHGGWILRRGTGAALENAQSLAAQGIRDGDVLHLVARRSDWPEPEYDDVVEAIVAGARRTGLSWGAAATRRCALGAVAIIFAIALYAVVRAGPPWPLPATSAIGVAVAAALVGTALARAGSDAVAGAVVAAAGIPFAFVGGAVAAAPRGAGLTGLGAGQLLLGSALAVLVGVAGYLGVAGLGRLFATGCLAGVLGLLAGLLGVGTRLSTAGVAAVVLTVAVTALPGYPLLAMRIGRLPLPELPRRAEDILADPPHPPGTDIFAAVARSDEVLTGLLAGTAVAGLAAMYALAVRTDATQVVLVLCAAGAMALRARLFPVPRQRLALLGVGFVGLAGLLVVAVDAAQTGGGRVGLAGLALAAAAMTLGAGLIYSRRPPSPYVGRAADIADVLLIIALIPLTCAVVGLYGYVQHVFASIGS